MILVATIITLITSCRTSYQEVVDENMLAFVPLSQFVRLFVEFIFRVNSTVGT